MAVTISATVTKNGAMLALNRLTGNSGGGGGGARPASASGGSISGPNLAKHIAHGIVHEFFPDVFYSNMYGWKATRRPGMPLLDTATHLVTGVATKKLNAAMFGAGSTVTIRHLFKYAHVHDRGMTIRAKNAKYLRYKIRGVGWGAAKEVTIPRRRFMFVSPQMKTFAVGRANTYLKAIRSGRAPA